MVFLLVFCWLKPLKCYNSRMNKPTKSTFSDNMLHGAAIGATVSIVFGGYLWLKAKLFPNKKNDKTDSFDGIMLPAAAGAAFAGFDALSDASIIAEVSASTKNLSRTVGKTALFSAACIAIVELIRAIFPRKENKENIVENTVSPHKNTNVADATGTKWQEAVQNQQQQKTHSVTL